MSNLELCILQFSEFIVTSWITDSIIVVVILMGTLVDSEVDLWLGVFRANL